MSRSSYIFTSESVSEGHPDKVADRISDTVVDAFLSVDPEARVACETLVTTNRIVLAGEVRAGKPGGDKAANKQLTKDILKSLEPKVRAAIKDIGYEQKGFHWEKAKYANYLHGQSAHIAQGVDASDKKDEGAGDQGIMFGYASTETPELMPATLQYSHNILSRLAQLRHSGELSELEPDAKSQVTLEYDGAGKPVRVVSIVVSHQHKKKIGGKTPTSKRVLDLIKPHILPIFPDGLITKKTQWLVNPTGRFEIGGPDGDAGVTGRKIIVDTYGGAAPHGGGAFSGKDPTKVDRSAAYACRYLAKNVVAAGLADRCTIQIAYAIGVAQPVSFHVDLHGTGKVDPAQLEKLLPQLIGGATPRSIREHLQLNKPIYARTAAYGHFGRTPDNEGGFSWEKTDLVSELKGLA
ncbi:MULTISPECIES: methionine adenosyltransferase [Caulobacter]|uniref:methionine adenosyltransferase n=1 Tax=Caulobacter TaxID=75 RepID=UPI0006F43E43|nr:MULTISPECIES: methionine adenosyltransferase [Caulobacter]KQZ28578.1 S-adenosylmethionine synthetase [Caulobacter sp. Root1472]GGL17010.1 methionine adenosyltransferase [Caulobacter rhizosphaerae]